MPKNRKSSPAAPLWASQNDLTSARIIRRLIQRSNLTNADQVIEIGPGKGHITRSLPETCRHVTAVELDRALSLRLTEQFAGAENLTLRCADFCRTSLPKKGDYKVFANIPFSQTTDILRHLTECQNPPSDAYLILEKEAAKCFMGNAALLEPEAVLYAGNPLSLPTRGFPPEAVHGYCDASYRAQGQPGFAARDGMAIP